MNINIICIGKLKENYWREACAEYKKRLGIYCRLNIIELEESKLPKNASIADEQDVIKTEGKNILSKISKKDFVIACEVSGKLYSSEELASEMCNATFEHSTIDFIIGGSLGLSEEALDRANIKFSFGKITLPHQLARVVALEQIYRAFKINNNEIYHK